MVGRNDVPELLGEIIDIFEDFLEDKEIDIENEEKKDSENPAIIYGSDYGKLQSEIEDLLIGWKIIGK